MSNTAPITTHIDRAWFSILSKNEILDISVKKITEPKSFEKAGAFHQDGLYSNALGATKRFDICTTCEQNSFNCPGHYGHIELAAVVYNPMLVQVMFQILNKSCIECNRFRLSQTLLKLFLAQLEALNCGFDHLTNELEDIMMDMCQNAKEKTDDSYMAVALGKKLLARIQEEKAKTPDFDCRTRPQQRSIVEKLSKLYRNFINGNLIKPSKNCPYCGAKKITMALHQQSVINISASSSKTIEELSEAYKIKSAKKLKVKKKGIFIDNNDLNFIKSDDKVFLTPVGARHYMRQLWKNERRTMERLFHFLNIEKKEAKVEEKEEGAEDDDGDVDPKAKLKKEVGFQPVDLFFIDTILVPPPKFRPPMSQRGYSFEGPRTAAMSAVMKQSEVVQDLIDQVYSEPDEIEVEKLRLKLQSAWRELQICVNCMYDNEMDKYGKKQYPGLKQLIDKKEGLFRKNMMGKRVNFAARSVISPDPNILVDQIGVPLVFAKKLSYPQPVTPFNIQQLKQAVLNGPDVYPGAMSVVYEDGMTVSLVKESVRQHIASRLTYHPKPNRYSQDKPDSHMATIVNRHLQTGDVLLFNRQPTLHKPSIMAFRARVLPNEKGFRLHYANCKSFNADFDGDEMNAHLLQSELARAEAYHIASVNHQYLVPKDGSPLGGLIQDHVVAGCILTRRDQFFDKDRYQQLVYCALEFLDKPLKHEPPTIIRPKHLWTGKQVITSIIKNCIPEGKAPPTLDIKSKIGPKILNISKEYEKLSDCHVIIRNGELMVGFMDKSNVGATQYGLIHLCYELYGGETSSNLMSAFARLSTWYLQLYEGFTLGIADILCEDDADEDRQQSIKESLYVGNDSAKEALGLADVGDVTETTLEDKLREAHSDRNPLPMKKLDAAMKSRTDKFTSQISGRCLPEGLIRRFPDNNLQMMIQSGAKGGTVNALQISCLLGQIELEGRRVPLSMSGRSLPSFKPYDTSPKAGGFVSGRFLTGIQPQEFFFHCMAGREGLIDTAVKTSRSGYLQRCLIKHLEGLTVQYDQTVRDSCGSVIQFFYGEDGLDIVKCQMLKDKAFPLLVDNYRIVSPSEDELSKLEQARERYEAEVIDRTNEIQEWVEKNGEDRCRKMRGSGFLDFLEAKLCELREQLNLTHTSFGSSVDGAGPNELASDEHPDQQQQLSAAALVKTETAAECIKVKTEIKHEDDSEAESDSEQANLSAAGVVKKEEEPVARIGSHHHDQNFDSWYGLSFKEKKKWNKKWELCPDPLTSLMNPAAHFGVVPEKLDERMESFVKKNMHLIVDSACLPELLDDSARPKLTKHEFYNLCYNLYMKKLASPGEAVGLLAAQSIGEPSTQMTLNTFHFAGRGEMNVTLGIPRLREILMTASPKIGTPSMDLPLLRIMLDDNGEQLEEEAIEEKAKQIRLALNAVRLSDVLEYVDITEQVVKHAYGQQAAAQGKKAQKRPRQKSDLKLETDSSVRYEFTFVLLPSKYYKHEFRCSSSQALKFIEEVFVGHLTDAMLKRQRRLLFADEMYNVMSKKLKERSAKQSGGGGAEDTEEQDLDEYNAKAKMKEATREEEESSEDDEDGDGDNTTQRMKNRRNQDLDYEEPEDEDLEVAGNDLTEAKDEENDDDVLGGDPDQTTVAATTTGASGQGSPDEQVLDETAKLGADENDETTEEPTRKKSRIDGSSSSRKSSRCKLDAETIERRLNEVKMKPYVLDYEFDTKHERWCKLTLCMDLCTTRIDMGALVEAEARQSYVHRVGAIQRALIVKDVNAKSLGAKCDKMIKTEGVSLLSLVEFNNILDLNAIYTNDIHAIANTYGIEAASQAIRREMANVFAVYGIEVDSRHLSLIADYMTYNGSIRGMNRMSMEASASPFQQMSYESTLRYLKWAAILGLYDDIKSPSAALVFGKPTRGGTGIFALQADPKLKPTPQSCRQQPATSGKPLSVDDDPGAKLIW